VLDQVQRGRFYLPGLVLILTLLLAACGAGPTPVPGAGRARPGATITYRPARVRTSTPELTATVTRPLTATPTPRPTATWVPLPSPYPSATGPGRSDVPLLGLGDAWTLAAVGQAVFVDVRPRANYEQERIPDAISMPVGEVSQRVAELPTDRLLILYCNCKAEAESIEGALTAMEGGLTRVAVLQGGWQAWLQAGYQVEGSQVSGEAISADGRALGSPDAPVVMVEFSDFQCPYCAQYALETLPLIEERYIETGLVYYIFKDLPLSFHAQAQKAAEASHCAAAQDRFWEMHDLLFKNQAQWSALDEAGALAAFATYAAELELDVAAFEACLSSGEFAELVTRNQWEAERVGVQMVPSFLINERRSAGAYPFAEFQRLLEAELAKQE
jgi:protein-disulfide isomerase